MQIVKRNYSNKDVDMLITVSSILETAIRHKDLLQSKRAMWKDPFFDTLKAKIDTAIQTYLGIDSARDLRQSTQVIKNLQKQAQSDLAEIKVQIVEDFRGQKELSDELLRQLGFASYLKSVQKGDQEGLINLLYQFKLNLTPTMRKQIISGTGISPKVLDAVVGYADQLKEANVGQEGNKAARKIITQEAINVFNEIYNSVISISKIAVKFCKDNPALKTQFSYTKVSRTLNGGVKAVAPVAVPAVPDAATETINQ